MRDETTDSELQDLYRWVISIRKPVLSNLTVKVEEAQ